MTLSSVIDGKVHDWRWVKREIDTAFYIGDQLVGQLFKSRRCGWSAVHRLPSVTNGPVNGFMSRTAASVYLEQIERMHRENK